MFSADDLECFREVALRGSLAAAAKQLGVDHTTVGRHITKLERTVGERLFFRKSNGWDLTDAGIRLLGYAETVHTAVMVARENYSDAAKGLTGSVRAVTPEGFAAYLLAPGLGRLRSQYPELSVEVLVANRHAALRTREYDIAVSIERPETRAVVVEKLADFELVVYASPQYLQTSPPIRSNDDLAAHPFIWYVEEALTLDPVPTLQTLIPGVSPYIQTTSLTGQIAAASQGLGLALLPSWIADREAQLVRVQGINVVTRRSYWMLTPNNLARLARVQAIAKLIYELAAAHPGLRQPR